MNRRPPFLAAVMVALIVGVLGGALVAGTALTGATAQSSSASAAPTTVSGAVRAKPCGGRLKQLSPELRADLVAARKGARTRPVEERRAALRKIVKAARAGDYGKRAQEVTRKRLEARKTTRKAFPAALKADLRQARLLEGSERTEARRQIHVDVLAGKYGEKVQERAEKRKAHRESCRANRKSTGND
jgi:hypothetical protein